MAEHDDVKKVGDWLYLWREIKRRTLQPLSRFPFIIYVIVAIIGLGCLGIWVELIKLALQTPTASQNAVLTALCTFFPALIGSTAFQLILGSTGRSDKIFVSIGYFVLILGLGGVILITLFSAQFPDRTYWAAVLFSGGAVWLWWITNGDDPTYKSTPVDAASGGDPGRDLKGNTRGFKE